MMALYAVPSKFALDGPMVLGRDSYKTQGAVDREISKLQKQMRNMVTCW